MAIIEQSPVLITTTVELHALDGSVTLRASGGSVHVLPDTQAERVLDLEVLESFLRRAKEVA